MQSANKNKEKQLAASKVLIKDHFVVSGSCLNAESRWEDFKGRYWEAQTDGASSKGFNPIILFECGSVRCEGKTANDAGCLKGFNQRSLCGERYLFECRVPMGSRPLLGSQKRRRLQQRFQSYHFVRMRKRAMRRKHSQRRWLHQRFQSKINLCERHLLG